MDQTPQKALRNKNLENISKFVKPIAIPSSPLLKQLGFGTGVTVYKLDRSPVKGVVQSPWAIKRVSKISRATGDKIYNLRLKSEAEILRKLSHPNIIGFRAFEKNTDGFDSLAIECCRTCLGTILEDRKEDELGPLQPKFILKMMVDVSNALDYLHTKAKLLHGDLKSYNVLVKGEFEICKLCDFGVSIPLDENGLADCEDNSSLRYIGTDLWLAPEVVDDEFVICGKAEIFSFGLIIYETIALEPPHLGHLFQADCNNENDDSKENSAPPNIDGCTNGTRPPLPESFELTNDYNQIVELFYVCTNALPEDRPTAKTIFDITSKIIA